MSAAASENEGGGRRLNFEINLKYLGNQKFYLSAV